MISSTRRKKLKTSYQQCTEGTRSLLSRNEQSMHGAILHHQPLIFGCMTSRVVQRNETADRSAMFRGCVQATALNEQIYIYRLEFHSPNSERTFLDFNKFSSYSFKIFGHQKHLILMLL